MLSRYPGSASTSTNTVGEEVRDKYQIPIIATCKSRLLGREYWVVETSGSDARGCPERLLTSQVSPRAAYLGYISFESCPDHETSDTPYQPELHVYQRDEARDLVLLIPAHSERRVKGYAPLMRRLSDEGAGQTWYEVAAMH